LNEQPRDDRVSDGNLINIPPLQFGEERFHALERRAPPDTNSCVRNASEAYSGWLPQASHHPPRLPPREGAGGYRCSSSSISRLFLVVNCRALELRALRICSAGSDGLIFMVPDRKSRSA
jgi:hypothetical protein